MNRLNSSVSDIADRYDFLHSRIVLSKERLTCQEYISVALATSTSMINMSPIARAPSTAEELVQ